MTEQLRLKRVESQGTNKRKKKLVREEIVQQHGGQEEEFDGAGRAEQRFTGSLPLT